MSSKSRGGLSKREYAAKKAGGTLNYKTGKISVTKKVSSPKKSSSYGTDPTLDTEMGDLNKWTPEYGRASDVEVAPKYRTSSGNYDKKESKKRSDSIKTPSQVAKVSPTQRSGANKEFKWEQSKQNSTVSPWRRALASGINAVKNTSPIIGSFGRGLNSLGFDLTNTLGIPAKAQTTDDYFQQAGDESRVLGAENNINKLFGTDLFDTTSSNTQPYEPSSEPSTPNDVLNLGKGPINYPGVTDKPTTSRQTPQPVSNPFKPTVGNSTLSNLLNPLREAQQPDMTPIAPNNGTVRRPVGSGQFSNGWAGNGAGNYGFGGGGGLGMGGGNPMQEEKNLFNQLFRINTAQASYAGEQPQQIEQRELPADFYQTTNPVPDYNDPNKYGYIGEAPTWNEDVSDTTMNYYKNYMAQQGGENIGMGGGQAIETGNPQQEYINQLIKQADAEAKAQKKAWKKLQKQIKEQYRDLEAKGTKDMNEQQFDDTLKMSGTFNLANADPNDEQRLQYQARMKQDYATQLADLLSNLSKQREADLESGESSYESALSKIANKKQAQKYKLAQLLYNAAKKGASGGYYDWANAGNLEDEYYA